MRCTSNAAIGAGSRASSLSPARGRGRPEPAAVTVSDDPGMPVTPSLIGISSKSESDTVTVTRTESSWHHPAARRRPVIMISRFPLRLLTLQPLNPRRRPPAPATAVTPSQIRAAKIAQLSWALPVSHSHGYRASDSLAGCWIPARPCSGGQP
jgi:hypothetical protein